MFSSKDVMNPAYPTQWALNPNAYQNVDSSQVDWAALAQQWIAMKEAAAIVSAPPPPSMKPDAEEGEAPMEVENPDTIADSSGPEDWNNTSNSWESWNQWGWGWPGSGDSKVPGNSTATIPPLIDGYPAEGTTAALPGYTTGTGTNQTYQHGYWTQSQNDQPTSRSSSSTRDRRSKSRNRERSSRSQRTRDKPAVVPSVIDPVVMPTLPTTTIDAAKRRQLPAWIREGLEKMEREKQKAIEREQEKKAREEAEKEKKRLEKEELERIKAEAGGQPVMPAKSKFETDSEGEEEPEEKKLTATPPENKASGGAVEPFKKQEAPPLIKKSKEEIMQEVMLSVRRSLTEILLEVTDHEIHTVSQEELARYNAAQASRLNAMKASKSKALAAISSGLGLGAYESSSEGSGDEEDQNDLTDQQLQDIIKRKRLDFERTAREIEADVRRAELHEASDSAATPHSTPDKRRHRSSATPPPILSETPEKILERPNSKGNHKSIDKVDGVKKLDISYEEKPKKTSRQERTPSPAMNSKFNKETSSSSSSDSEDDSSSSSSESSSDSETESKSSKKRKHKNSPPIVNSPKKIKKKIESSYKSDVKSSSRSRYGEYEKLDKSRSKKYDKYSSSREYERSHKDKYRDYSDDDRPRKRSKRSRSTSYSSRRRSKDRSEERSRRKDKRHDRDRSHERDYKYDRYERCSRDYDRRSSSHTRHRR